ncbi:MAG: hypothetical protein FE78DRAFT_104194 [Acidomyces sp. 'richmondensis']|nr:MAG: hypothetical protein FE78DRAFT_104194 [Acidomyces sp. 'richmondensis']
MLKTDSAALGNLGLNRSVRNSIEQESIILAEIQKPFSMKLYQSFTDDNVVDLPFDFMCSIRY